MPVRCSLKTALQTVCCRCRRPNAPVNACIPPRVAFVLVLLLVLDAKDARSARHLHQLAPSCTKLQKKNLRRNSFSDSTGGRGRRNLVRSLIETKKLKLRIYREAVQYVDTLGSRFCAAESGGQAGGHVLLRADGLRFWAHREFSDVRFFRFGVALP